MQIASLFLCLLFLGWSVPASAMRLTPNQQVQAREAFEDADRKQWSTALSKARAVKDAITLSVMEWHYATSNDTEPDFYLIRDLLKDHPDWPLKDKLLLQAERALMREPQSVAKIEDWLKQYPAVSGAGHAALALALPDNDKRRPELLRKAWREGGFSGDLEDRFFAAALPYLTEGDHLYRIERLLWEDQASAAARMVDLLPKNKRALFEARIGLQQRAKDVNHLVAAVPSSQKDDEGLQYDRLRWRHAKSLESGVIEILNEVKSELAHPDKWWTYRAYYGREYMEKRHYAKAHALMSQHGLHAQAHTADFADAMWMLGWLELRYLEKPKDAYKRFYAMFQAVGTPVSKARAAYWAGRAAAANGHTDIAKNWYGQAAKHSTVFYGQLAAQELGQETLAFEGSTESSIGTRNKVARLSLYQAVNVLYSVEQENLAKHFLKHAVDVLGEPAHKIAMADDMAVKLRWMHGGVVGAKQALRTHAVALTHGWPLPKAPTGALAIEPELMFAIARQESEMDPRATSHADARGLMQLLPGTAKQVARKLDMGFSSSKLYEPDYNMRLGTRYLGDLIDGFDGAWVLGIASYNAGPANVRKWISRFGNPPRDLYARIDWLETIPFRETRNYVQRVLENAQTYRHRLGMSAPNRIKADVLR